MSGEEEALIVVALVALAALMLRGKGSTGITVTGGGDLPCCDTNGNVVPPLNSIQCQPGTSPNYCPGGSGAGTGSCPGPGGTIVSC